MVHYVFLLGSSGEVVERLSLEDSIVVNKISFGYEIKLKEKAAHKGLGWDGGWLIKS